MKKKTYIQSTSSLWIFTLIIMGVLTITNSCSKDDVITNFTNGLILTTSTVCNITDTTATSGGNISSGGDLTITARGVCWSINTIPTIADSISTDGTGTDSYTSQIIGLTADTTYYVRAYALVSSEKDTVYYGNTLTFTAQEKYGTETQDIDGNVYRTVTIGTQVWMVENLNTTKYRNGDSIPNITDNAAWWALTSGAYCNYANDANNGATYGRLYNWYAVSDRRNIAPVGWHVPTDAEWTTLTEYLTKNGYGYEGSGSDISKSMAATSGWSIHTFPGNVGYDQGSNNSIGFTALPGGDRTNAGLFYGVRNYGFWWSSTLVNAYNTAWYRFMFYDRSYISKDYGNRTYGFSVRCLKDKVL